MVLPGRNRFGANLTGGIDRVLHIDGIDDVADGDVELGEPVRLDPEPHRILAGAENLDTADSGDARDLIGKIAPGFKADLVFLDLDHVNLVPLNSAVNQLVNTEDGAAVRDVMIGGRFALKDGVLPGLDWKRIVSRARDAAARLAEANAAARPVAESLAPVVNHFCVGLGRCAHDLPRKLRAETMT